MSPTTGWASCPANPDGRELNTRGNADGLDLNRDHLRLRTVEARAMARALRDLRPDFVADLHEFGTSSPDRPALEVIWPRHLNVGMKYTAAERR
jgi:predicted deacylase